MGRNLIWSTTRIYFRIFIGALGAIFVCDNFIMVDDINIANYADDNTPFVSGDTSLNVITSLEQATERLYEWFTNNRMKDTHDKWYLLMITLTPIPIKVKRYIKNSDNEKLLGVAVDANLNFSRHLENILKKLVKVQVLARIAPYISIPKRKLLINSSLLPPYLDML